MIVNTNCRKMTEGWFDNIDTKGREMSWTMVLIVTVAKRLVSGASVQNENVK